MREAEPKQWFPSFQKISSNPCVETQHLGQIGEPFSGKQGCVLGRTGGAEQIGALPTLGFPSAPLWLKEPSPGTCLGLGTPLCNCGSSEHGGPSEPGAVLGSRLERPTINVARRLQRWWVLDQVPETTELQVIRSFTKDESVW